MNPSDFSRDIQDFIKLLAEYDVRYVIVGGKAVIYYGFVRVTGDVDFFYDSSEENATKLFSLLSAFWGGSIPGIKKVGELMGDDVIIQFGRPPNRIDLITKIESVRFEEAWASHLEEKIIIDDKEYPIYFINVDLLIKNKESVGRPRDMMDLKYLRKLKKKKKS